MADGKDGFVFNIPLKIAPLKEAKTVASEMAKIKNHIDHIQTNREYIRKTCFDYPFSDIYIVLKAYDDNTYDLIQSAGDEYEFSFSNLGDQVASNLFKNTTNGTDVQGSLSRVPSIQNGTGKAIVGDSVQVSYYDSSRQKPYIRRIVKRGPLTIVTGTTTIEYGEWMQTEGNPALARPGKTNIYPMPESSGLGNSAIAFFPSTEEAFGLKNLLGLVCGTGSDSNGEQTGIGTLYMTAFFVPDSSLSTTELLRVRAYEGFPSYSLKWTFDIAATGDNPTPHTFRSNIFWNKENRILTIADRKVWSILVPETGGPTVHGESPIDAKYCFSALGTQALVCNPDSYTLSSYKINSDNIWQQVGSNYNLGILNSPDTALSWLATATGFSGVGRPWPGSNINNCFYVMWQGLKRIDKIIKVKEGTFSVINSGVIDTGVADLEFSAALDKGDLYARDRIDDFRVIPSASVSNPNPQTPFTGFTTAHYEYTSIYVYTGTDPSTEYEYLQETHDWGGRLSATYLPGHPVEAGAFGTFWYWNTAVGSDTPPVREDFGRVPIANAGKENLGYYCPRLMSNNGPYDSFNSYSAAIWPEQLGPQPQSAGDHVPHLQLTSTGHLIYAKICSVRALVPSNKSTQEVVTISKTVGPDDFGYTEYHNTYYHWPQQEFLGETFLFKVEAETGAFTKLSLSNHFNGLTYYADGFPSGYFPVNLTETLPVPENVWDIKIGLEQEESTPGDWTDTIFLVQDWRTEALKDPRPLFRVISSELTPISSLSELLDEDVFDSTPGTKTDTFTLTVDDTSVFLSELTIDSITSVTLNSVSLADGTDYQLFDPNEIQLNVTISDGDILEVEYVYIPQYAGQFVWVTSDVKLFINLGTLFKWALIGVYSFHRQNGASKTDIHLVNLADLNTLEIDHTETFIGSYTDSKLLRPEDFDRLAANSSGIWWIQQDPTDENFKLWSMKQQPF